nr:MAG TPA: hypothetical protein [Herelleviridae sp.]
MLCRFLRVFMKTANYALPFFTSFEYLLCRFLRL